MSYCVNCGVELDASAKKCALCNTPVYHPQDFPEKEAGEPFPTQKGDVETVKRKDFGILLTTFVLATSATCAILNACVFSGSMWSLAVIGVCVVLWVMMIPVVIFKRQPIYLSLLLDGAAVVLYLYMLARMVDSYDWFYGLGLPIVLVVTLVAECFTFCVCRFPRAFLVIALELFTGVGILCAGLEAVIDRYLSGGYEPLWSAVVVTVCVILDIVIITLLSRRRLRNAVRRRLHF